jgi:hypothetical protein
MKIATYARVSTETQSKECTIDSQIEALHDYAKSHELTIIQEFIDDQPFTAPAHVPCFANANRWARWIKKPFQRKAFLHF